MEKTPLLEIVPVLKAMGPPVHVVAPLSTSERERLCVEPVSTSDEPEGIVVLPVPPIVPPDHEEAPLNTNCPAPASAPPESVSGPALALPDSKEKVPPDISSEGWVVADPSEPVKVVSPEKLCERRPPPRIVALVKACARRRA